MFEKIKMILLQYTEVTAINEDSMLQADLGLSSLDVVEIVAEFEEAFHIEIPDRDLTKFVSVRDIVEYLENRMKNDGTGGF